MLENVRGLASARFTPHRTSILTELERMKYQASWQLPFSSDFGVPQLRPRFILVAVKKSNFEEFEWPGAVGSPTTVGVTPFPLMSANGWRGAKSWAMKANGIGPTVIGRSKKHGGADLGPTRAK